MINLDELEQLAKNATPGPWEAVYTIEGDGAGFDVHAKDGLIVKTGYFSKNKDDDAHYIAKVSPQVILDMISIIKHYKILFNNNIDKELT